MTASRTARLVGALVLGLCVTGCISLSLGGKPSSADVGQNEIQLEAGEVQKDECSTSCCSDG